MEQEVMLKLTPAQAIEIYKTASPDIKKILELNFPKGLFSQNKLEMISDFDDILTHLNINKNDFFNSIEKLSKKKQAFEKLLLIEEFFNKDEENKGVAYYPFFERKSFGLVFYYSYCVRDYSSGAVAKFFNQKHSDFVGRTFIPIYEEFING